MLPSYADSNEDECESDYRESADTSYDKHCNIGTGYLLYYNYIVKILLF